MFAALGVIAVVLISGALWVSITVARHDAAAAKPSATKPQASVFPMSEETACYALVPLIGDALKDVNAITAKPDGSTVDWDRLDDTIAGLQGAQSAAPADMRSDIEAHLAPLIELRGIHEGTSTGSALELGGYREAALRLLERCKPYAHD